MSLKFISNLIATNHIEKPKNILYLRVFEGCNLHCEHCFIPKNPKKISDDFFENNKLSFLLENEGRIPKGENVYIQWHGGEPTILGCDYLEKKIIQIEKNKDYVWEHGIQTNLINYKQYRYCWVNLYKKYFNNTIGVSWDYDLRSFTEDKTKGKKSFDELFFDNLKLVSDDNIDIYLVITLTKKLANRFKDLREILDLFESYNVIGINFERITKTGLARENWKEIGLNNLEYSTLMQKYFKQYLQYKQIKPNGISVSPFDGLIISNHKLLEESNTNNNEVLGYGCWNNVCDTHYHTIDANGYKHGCTALNSEYDNKNSKESSPIIFLKRDDILTMRKEKTIDCQGCFYKKICSSGCMTVSKIDESEECSGSKKLLTLVYEYVKKNC